MGALGCGLGYFGTWNLGRLSGKGEKFEKN